MLAFVVPVKPKFNSKNWISDNKLLQRTIKSLCNQTNNSFRVYIVYHDKPDIEFSHPNIRYIQLPYTYIPSEQIEDLHDYALKYYSRQYAEYMLDKGKKITYGCKLAKEEGCSYIMAIDSDDLVSSKLSDFVNTSKSNCCGWVVQNGYMHVEGSSLVIKNRRLQSINGSTHIIRQDLVPIPDFTGNKLWDYNFFEAHGYLAQRVIHFHNGALDILPFNGTIYIIHKTNTSQASKLFKPLHVKTILKYLLQGKWINNSLRKEFFLYDVYTC